MENDITIVTAFFDLGRGSLPTEVRGRVLPHYQHRNNDTYFDYFNKQAKLQNDMVVYTTKDFAEKVHDIRKQYGLENRTKIVIMDSYLPDEMKPYKQAIEKIQSSPAYIDKITNPHLIEYWHTDYVLVNIFKAFYVTHAINSGLVKTDLTAWIDFGYCRNDTTVPPSSKWSYNFDVNKMHLFNIRTIEPERPIDSIIYTGDVYIMGCHIVGGTKQWEYFRGLIIGCLNKLIEHNLIDDDQTLLLMSYLTNPSEFELHYVDPSDWFIIFKKFNLNA
jgi:protein YibB